jgi:predicted lipoprotein with Yx(FWY)xxD motif
LKVMPHPVRIAGFLAAIALAETALAASPADRLPPQVTIHPTSAGPVYADAKTKMTLYVFDRDLDQPGLSTCVDQCAEAWPPVLAAAGARPFGDWTLVDRGNGVQQWAFKGRPLYRYGAEARPGVAWGNGNGVWHYADTSWEEIPKGRGLKRPHVLAELRLTADVPAGITGREIAGSRAVYADYRGMTLYQLSGDCSGECMSGWRAAPAPAAAVPRGAWSVFETSEAGTPQWAYKGSPLFTCDADLQPSEVNCESRAWRAVRYQPGPEVLAEARASQRRRNGGGGGGAAAQ